MAIDFTRMSLEDIAFAKQQLVMSPQERFDEIVKPKRKQRGRKPTKLEIDFGLHCQSKPNLKYWAKPFVLRILPSRTFEPDAMVEETTDQAIYTWIIDTKGEWTDGDSRLKICIAAEKYPLWRWLIVTWDELLWRAKECTAAKGIHRTFIKLPWLR